MKFEDYFLYMIQNYVFNEIEYLSEEIEIGNNNKDNISVSCYEKDLDFLTSLNWNDLVNILDNIFNNTDIEEKINDIIQEYLYKYKNEKGGNK